MAERCGRVRCGVCGSGELPRVHFCLLFDRHPVHHSPRGNPTATHLFRLRGGIRLARAPERAHESTAGAETAGAHRPATSRHAKSAMTGGRRHLRHRPRQSHERVATSFCRWFFRCFAKMAGI